MPDRLLLIDGMYLIFSSYYSHRNMSTLRGEPTGAVYGFINRTESLIRELAPNKIVVALDSREENFRARLYPEYKARRSPPPEDLLKQIPLVKEYLEARRIPFYEIPGFEADDIIAHLSRKHGDEDEVWIFSADKDLFQLVDSRVHIFHPKLKQSLDRESLKNYFGVYPEQVVDYLQLLGDSSDNIPGIPGVGEKTALKLMEKYGSLDAILEHLDELEPRTAKKINENAGILEWTKALLDLKQIPEVPVSPEPASFQDTPGDELWALYERLAFQSLLKKRETSRADESDATLGIEYHPVLQKEELKNIREKVIGKGRFAFDVETTHLDFFRSSLVGLSIFVDNEGWYFPFLLPQGESERVDYSWEDFVREFAPLFSDPAIAKTGHNVKFDMLQLRSQGVDVRGIADDSMLLSYLLHPNRRTHNLKDLALELLKYRPVEFAQLVGKGKQAVLLQDVPLQKISRYCIDDSAMSMKLANMLKPEVENRRLLPLYEMLEMPLLPVLAEMEFTGVRMDREYLDQAARILTDRISETEEAVYELGGYRLNLNSPQQLGELLFERLGLPMGKKTRKTKAYSTDIEVLNELKGFPIVEKLIEYRTYKKLLSTYVEGLSESCDERDRIHTSFNQTVTATGRLSSSNPNLQNIPVGELGGVTIRRAFIPENGWKLLAADYSQIELRVMAHFSEDANLILAFQKDLDIHRHTADLVFGKFSDPAETRRRAKIINFSILYGSGAFSLSKELGVGIGEARAFIDSYFSTYQGVRNFIDRSIAAAETELEVRTLAGRVRPIPEIQSQNHNVKENGNRMAINTIIQGSAADIIKMAMISIHKEISGMRSRMLMQVHDELVFEYPPEEEARLVALVRREMENAFSLRVPLKVSIKSGANWGDMGPIS